MHAFAVVERAFRFHRQDLVDLLFEIRNLVSRVYPSATERIGAHGLTFFDSEKGGTISGGICFVDIRKNHVRLRFGRGAYLEDPKSLLKGDPLHMRYMDIASFETAPWAEIEALIRASADQIGR